MDNRFSIFWDLLLSRGLEEELSAAPKDISPQKYLIAEFRSLNGCSNTGSGFIEYFIQAQASGCLPGSGWMKV